ncbi:MAG: DUF3800 domain-containing protein [Gemmatimonadota bacterium]|nr:DUF3800 domain-containing protein [Gemmatimonadota bacterium]
MAEIAYIDESYDSSVFVMCALVIPEHAWRADFVHLQNYRRYLKGKYGIFTSKEFHATEFVTGRGRIAPKPIPKGLRARIFKEYLEALAGLPAAIISGCWSMDNATLKEVHIKAFSRIQERLQTRSARQNSHIITIADEGRATELQRIARRSRVWNPVGSQFGSWEDGSAYKNIPNDRLLEDPIFKSSQQSYFLQSVDFIAYALLKSEVKPTPHVKKYGLDRAYELLDPICAKEASRKDPRNLGIVRT